jgi:hypothetical protein
VLHAIILNLNKKEINEKKFEMLTNIRKLLNTKSTEFWNIEYTKLKEYCTTNKYTKFFTYFEKQWEPLKENINQTYRINNIGMNCTDNSTEIKFKSFERIIGRKINRLDLLIESILKSLQIQNFYSKKQNFIPSYVREAKKNLKLSKFYSATSTSDKSKDTKNIYFNVVYTKKKKNSEHEENEKQNEEKKIEKKKKSEKKIEKKKKSEKKIEQEEDNFEIKEESHNSHECNLYLMECDCFYFTKFSRCCTHIYSAINQFFKDKFILLNNYLEADPNSILHLTNLYFTNQKDFNSFKDEMKIINPSTNVLCNRPNEKFSNDLLNTIEEMNQKLIGYIFFFFFFFYLTTLKNKRN